MCKKLLSTFTIFAYGVPFRATREGIDNFNIALRIPFTTPGSKVEYEAIGKGKFDVELLVLDLKGEFNSVLLSARLVTYL